MTSLYDLRRRHFTDAQIKSLVKAYNSGQTIDQIARSMGVGYQVTRRQLLHNGVKTRSRGSQPKITAEQRKGICADYLAGATMWTLAGKYGLGISSVHRIIHESNVPETIIRARHRANGGPHAQASDQG